MYHEMSVFRLVEKRKTNNLSTLVTCVFLSDEKVTSTKINLSGYFNVVDKETEKNHYFVKTRDVISYNFP